MNTVIFHVHEWTGYEYEREKKIKYCNKNFTCGLKFSLEKLNDYKGKYNIEKYLTLSDYNEEYSLKLREQKFFAKDTKIFPVSNIGMDFSGYAFVAQKIIRENENICVFFSNSSVNALPADFIDDYMRVFLQNKNLGLLGISYSSKIYQTLVKNNFYPHIQSFFFLTTSHITNEVISSNNNLFPGTDQKYKLSLIRFGEARLTRIVQELGYDVGVINSKGELQLLPYSDKSEKVASLVDGDYRLYAENPNAITEIK